MSDLQQPPPDRVPTRELTELLAQIAAAPARCGSVKLVCIDGPAGSGKTTLSGQLAAALAAPVVHLDDLFQGWEQDLGPGLAARLDAWLLTAWEAGLTGMHMRYDWEHDRFVQWVAVPAAPVMIIEGCGSGGAGIRERAGLVIWVSVPAPLRLARGLARDGAHLRAKWLGWQAREELHFAADATAQAADVHWSGQG
jgi:cytidylate kinase